MSWGTALAIAASSVSLVGPVANLSELVFWGALGVRLPPAAVKKASNFGPGMPCAAAALSKK